MQRTAQVLLGLLLGVPLWGCGAPATREESATPEDGRAIVVCGERLAVDAPVVLWFDEGGYDGYVTEASSRASGLRYRPGRDGIDGAPTLEELREKVDIFVLHYDAAGTSQRCFEVLQERRGLSVHFLLDVDGTIYQTLDLAEQAWHAGELNARSVGVEIANIGAYPADQSDVLERWYEERDGATVLRLPADSGVRTAGFVGSPARREPVTGEVHGSEFVQYDLTDEQYESLVALTAAVCRALPGVRPEVPRDENGAFRADALGDEELEGFRGVLGHLHATRRKRDPGPAFDWARLVDGLEAALGDQATGSVRP
jgi:N-acetyl-anhydromuramyl-L-alanine amidase AmpD